MSEEMEDNIHPHCLGCIKFKKCTARQEQGISCEIIPCDLECGFYFHACKKTEHKLLCSNEKVPCYNAENGCPCVMHRRLLAQHLTVCPASIVHCTMEWNRWHIDPHSVEQLQRCTGDSQKEQPQLDVALALRDQRMLRRWYNSNKNAQKVLRHYFWKPPSQSCDEMTPKTLQDESDSDAASLPTVSPQYNVNNQLYQAYEYYKNEYLTVISTGKSIANGHNSNGNDSRLFSNEDESENWRNYLNNRKCSQFNDLGYRDEANSSPSNCDCWHKKDEKNDSLASCDIEFLKNTNYDRISPLKDDADSVFFDENVISAISPFPTRYLGLGPNLETSAYCADRHAHKNTMYTFLCSQEFRRDEYPWHYKNVHSEIHSGLNGWLQERCPLAQYGCTFSRQRLHPEPKGAKIVYNEILESFGIAPIPFESKQMINGDAAENGLSDESLSCRDITLSHLPYEVLQHIARFLDSFSLSNLALTSTLMREVCRSLLVELGIVAFQWERRKKVDGSFTWKATHKRWFYSSHFTPVKDWIFADDCSMANHLKTCAYFDRNRNKMPYYVLMCCPPNSDVYKKLSDSSMEACCENVTTKL